MSNLSTILGGGSNVDPRKEGLPLFAIGYASFNNHLSLRVIDSNFNIQGSPWGAMTHTTNGYSGGMYSDAMWGYGGGSSPDMGGWDASPLSTQTYSSWPEFVGSLHQHDQYPLGMYVDVNSDGMMNGQTRFGFASTKTNRGRYLINQILPEGCRPRRYFQMEADIFRECSDMGTLHSGIDSVDLATYRANTTNNVGRGSAGYNEKTKTLVTLHYSGTSVVINRFVSTVDLNSCDNLTEFFSAATVTSSTGTRTGTDHQGDTVVVVGDNGYVACQYRQGNNVYADSIAPDNTYTTSFYTSVNGTTSYGTDQGHPYYNKMQLSWDGKWAAAYSPYSYYGCGVLAHFFSVEDPRRYTTMLINKTSGTVLMPIGKSGFMVATSENTDSKSVNMNRYNFTNTDRTNHASATVYSHTNADGNIAIANGAAMNPSITWTNNLHGGHGTTCYPKFFTVNQWPSDKAR
jgi:hypothetical protein